MKKILLALFAVLFMSAAGSDLMARGMGKGNGGDCPGYGMNGGFGHHLNMLQDELKLTDEQIAKIHRIDMDYAEKFFQNRKNEKGSDKLFESRRAEIEKVLTKEQIVKWKESRGPKKGIGKGKGGPGMMHDYLKLTDEQSEKIHKLNREFHDKFFENRKDNSKLEKLREEHRKEFGKIVRFD